MTRWVCTDITAAFARSPRNDGNFACSHGRTLFQVSSTTSCHQCQSGAQPGMHCCWRDFRIMEISTTERSRQAMLHAAVTRKRKCSFEEQLCKRDLFDLTVCAMSALAVNAKGNRISFLSNAFGRMELFCRMCRVPKDKELRLKRRRRRPCSAGSISEAHHCIGKQLPF